MLTKRMQYQAIVDKLAGLPVRHTSADFEGRLKSLWEALEKAAPGREAQALYDVPGTPFERMELVDMIGSLKPGDDIGRLPTMSEVCRDMLPIEWLWPGWIPRGMITLLGAAPGSGKSLVALDLANRIIQGASFPDGQPVPNPGSSILYVDAEVATRINHQRAKDWNIDMDRIFLKLPDENDGVIDLSNLAHRERLVEQVIRNKSELVIIDALSNMSSRGENDIEDVRSLMVFLNRLAQDSDAGLLLIHHTRKTQAVRDRPAEFTMDDIRGSGHIIAMSRSVIGLTVIQGSGPGQGPGQGPGLGSSSCRSQPSSAPRLVRVLKTNLGPIPSPLSFELVSQENGSVLLRWGPPPQLDFSTPSSFADCESWLHDLLVINGEMRPAEIIQLAREEGFSRSLLYQVRNHLGNRILNSRPKDNPMNTWRLLD